MTKRNFTLVELLVVIGILAILAGLIIPAVVGAKQQGRITQARADMSSLRTAFEQLNTEYGKMMKKTGSKYYLGGVDCGSADDDGCVTIGSLSSNEYDSLNDYCMVIAELADPKNGSVTTSINKKGPILEPKSGYDRTKSPTTNDNKQNTWLDPWGNPFMIRINVDASDTIPDPSNSSKKLSGRVILWSLGPDGKGGTDEYDKDNIPSWKDGNWFD